MRIGTNKSRCHKPLGFCFYIVLNRQKQLNISTIYQVTHKISVTKDHFTHEKEFHDQHQLKLPTKNLQLVRRLVYC